MNLYLSSFTYTITEGNSDGTFSINQHNGTISTSNRGVDYNTKQTYSLIVVAQNMAHNCQRARIKINIHIISNSIKFNVVPIANVSEGTATGTVVGQVVATGGEGSLVYSLIAGNQNDTFNIDSTNGNLMLAKSLDYETETSYAITVRAVSTGSSINGNTTIYIQVQDINERPYFIMPHPALMKYSISVVENMPANIIGIFMAGDPDLSTTLNGTLVYQVSPDSLPFSVTSNGTLSSVRALDRETESVYELHLIVSDSCQVCNLSITALIQITVTDVNDNAPFFIFTTNHTEISEDLKLNTVIAEFIASDADEGSNAIIEFSLVPSNVPFTLNSSSGSLSLTGPIDYESVQSYSVTVTASNPGTSLAVTTTSTIQILNVNDNTPVISGEPYQVTVIENSPIGTLVTTINATDGDLGIHGEIRYTIISGDSGSYFDLNSTTGALTLKKITDREIVSSFSLVVRTRDKGTPLVRQDQTTVDITVSDVNDNPPIFKPNTYFVQLREDLLKY